MIRIAADVIDPTTPMNAAALRPIVAPHAVIRTTASPDLVGIRPDPSALKSTSQISLFQRDTGAPHVRVTWVTTHTDPDHYSHRPWALLTAIRKNAGTDLEPDRAHLEHHSHSYRTPGAPSVASGVREFGETPQRDRRLVAPVRRLVSPT